MVNTNISKSEKIVANTRVEKIVSKFEPPWPTSGVPQITLEGSRDQNLRGGGT